MRVVVWVIAQRTAVIVRIKLTCEAMRLEFASPTNPNELTAPRIDTLRCSYGQSMKSGSLLTTASTR